MRKKRNSDNWWSLFKSKAIGEKDTDEEDAEADRRDAEEAKKKAEKEAEKKAAASFDAKE